MPQISNPWFNSRFLALAVSGKPFFQEFVVAKDVIGRKAVIASTTAFAGLYKPYLTASL